MSTSTLTEKEKLIAETASVTTCGSLAVGATASALAFTPTKSFHINSKGLPVLGLGLPPSELVITLHNIDGSIAYRSTRQRRSSGSCVLTNAEGHELIGTTYTWGLKDPVLTRLDIGGGPDATIKTLSRWTSRSHKFMLPDGRLLEWAYKKEVGFGDKGKKGTALVLSLDQRPIAALVRNAETRTMGSNSCSAGNGGELVLGEDVAGKGGVGEEVVVATCLLMLKKEIDRRRATQIAIIT
jgi:hypothetical protein